MEDTYEGPLSPSFLQKVLLCIVEWVDEYGGRKKLTWEGTIQDFTSGEGVYFFYINFHKVYLFSKKLFVNFMVNAIFVGSLVRIRLMKYFLSIFQARLVFWDLESLVKKIIINLYDINVPI